MGNEKFEEISLLCQLGVNRDTLLKKIVGESNFENYTIEFQDELYYKIYPVKGYKEKELDNKKEKELDNKDVYFIKDMYDEKLGKNFGWKVILKPDQNGEKYKITTELKKRIEDKSRPKLKINGVHAGHLLAESFYTNNYIPLMECGNEDVHFRKNDSGKKNKYNIYPQFADSNCNSTNKRGQNYYEQRIVEYLKNSDKNAVIYYEIEAIFRNKEDKIPIGNRIKAELILPSTDLPSTDEKFKKFHVFIPNVAHISLFKFSYANGWDIPE